MTYATTLTKKVSQIAVLCAWLLKPHQEPPLSAKTEGIWHSKHMLIHLVSCSTIAVFPPTHPPTHTQMCFTETNIKYQIVLGKDFAIKRSMSLNASQYMYQFSCVKTSASIHKASFCFSNFQKRKRNGSSPYLPWFWGLLCTSHMMRFINNQKSPFTLKHTLPQTMEHGIRNNHNFRASC